MQYLVVLNETTMYVGYKKANAQEVFTGLLKRLELGDTVYLAERKSPGMYWETIGVAQKNERGVSGFEDDC